MTTEQELQLIREQLAELSEKVAAAKEERRQILEAIVRWRLADENTDRQVILMIEQISKEADGTNN